ncbi:MAG: UDP-3-O-(3-hydroxymyristoyl)glucosamine N-acyltransferase [Deltaproteobacteria bacterium]|nr:UDP-3-O-(3-hydroxymyristoyl)glucosamine N-acyltransferase [Deltaproteobacteria bacterium]
MRLPRPYSLKELAELAQKNIEARLTGLGSLELSHRVELFGDPDLLIEAISPIEALEPGCLTFALTRSYLALAEDGDAASVVLPDSLESRKIPFLRAPLPRLVFSTLLEIMQEKPSLVPAADQSVRFKERSSVTLGDGVIIGDWCYIGKDVKIGSGSRIYPQVFIDDHVDLGERCTIYPQAVILRNTVIGNRVIIHSGAVIGDDGFGYNQVLDTKLDRLHHLKNEHVGRVLIEDDVEVGSQVCIDRALAYQTVIGAGTKIDNLTQIGHNVRVGRDSIIVRASLAGSSQVGDKTFVLATKVSHGARIGDGAVTLSGEVISDIPDGEQRWAGNPLQPVEQELKATALVRKQLPRLRNFLRLLKKADSFEELKSTFIDSDK